MQGLVVPSKLYGVMAAGRPVVYIGPAQSEVAHVVQRHKLGWRVDPGNVEGLAAIVADATRCGDELAACGERARRRFVERHERALATTALRGLLLEAANLRVQ
jgi:glycosyltransferase involved in cell wall biosynthesis